MNCSATDTVPVADNLGGDRLWAAELSLKFDADGGYGDTRRTRLLENRSLGPLRVQRPFYPEGPICHCYLLHPPGGLVSGDNLHINVETGPGAHSVLTTPAAGKVYRSDSCQVEQHQQVTLRLDDGVCEWLPQETIVFDGANAVLDTCIDLSDQATFIGWDIICLGRPAGGELFCSGAIRQNLALYRNEVPLLLERQQLGGRDAALQEASAYAGATVSGTMMVVLPEDFEADRIASCIDHLNALELIQNRPRDFQQQGVMASVTLRLGVLIIRYLGHHGEQARQFFSQCRGIIRLQLMGLDPCEPRIWAT